MTFILLISQRERPNKRLEAATILVLEEMKKMATGIELVGVSRTETLCH